MSSILSAMIFIPFIGILFLMTIRGDENRIFRNSRAVRFIITASELLLCPFLLTGFDTQISGFQFETSAPWLGAFTYHIGVDGLSAIFIAAVIVIFFLITLIDWQNRLKLPREYTIFMLWLEGMTIALLASLDILLFALCFSGLFIPFFFLMGIWGKNEGKTINIFVLFVNSIGIILLVFGLIMLYLKLHDASLISLAATKAPLTDKELIFWSLFTSFGISILLFPLSAVNKINAEAPVSVVISIFTIPVMAGLFGFGRIILPLFSEQIANYSGIIIALSALGFLYFSLKAYSQSDLRKIFACFAGALICIIFSGVFSLSAIAVSGSFYLFLNYFFLLSAFCVCGEIIYSRRSSYHLNGLGGLFASMPAFTKLFFLFIAAAFCMPLTGGFPALLMLIIGFFGHFPIFSLFLSLSIVISAGYMIHTYWQVILGKPPENKEVFVPINPKEKVILLSCIGVIIALGIFSHWFMAFIFPALNHTEGWL